MSVFKDHGLGTSTPRVSHHPGVGPPGAAIKHIRGRILLRALSVLFTIAVGLLAAGIVVSMMMDLGTLARPYAEKYGSSYIERPLHIGALQIHLLRGQVVLENLRIDGIHPNDRPFFAAKRLEITLDWVPVAAWRPNFTIAAVELTDWQMLVEKWPEGHNFPHLTLRGGNPPGPRRFTVTMRHFRGVRGQFAFEDHEAPWSVVCPNLQIDITNVPNYHGTATFSGGMVTIQDYLPMSAAMKAQFVLDGPRVHLDRIDLETDGATTLAHGDVDLAHWPEQRYEVRSRVHFPRMRQIFFKGERWDVTGDGSFVGAFHLFKDGRDLSGTFASDLAGVNAYRFPGLYGTLHWTPALFEISNAGSKFYGGDAQFEYSIKPLGSKTRATDRFDVTLADVDLARFTDFEEFPGLRFAGAASLRNRMEWPSGKFSDHRGDGRLVVVPRPATSAHLPIAGELNYQFDPSAIVMTSSRFATGRTTVTFEGSTAWGDRSRFPFHVASTDWQESDRLLAGIMTDFGAPTHTVEFGGRGEFEGAMTGAFRRPRVAGTFRGQDMRAMDTSWGSASGNIVVEGSYLDVTDGVVRKDDSEIRADGRFSLGYPRDDGGEEIDARIRLARRDVGSLRHAFQIDEYPVSGYLSGEFHLTGAYTRPIGFGGLTLDEGVAYSEPFDKATALVRFDGGGVRLDDLAIAKSSGSVTGAAYVGWDGTYSFNADGRRIPIESIEGFKSPRATLSGLADFSVSGNGRFDTPRYDVKFHVANLVVGNQSGPRGADPGSLGVGPQAVIQETVDDVTGTIALRGKEVSGEIDAASRRLTLTGTGRVSLAPGNEAELTFRFHDASLDPYVRLFVPGLSPYTTAALSGSVRVLGALADPERLAIDGTVETLNMRLFDYAIQNAGPVHLAMNQGVVAIAELQLVGEDTRLRMSGSVDLHQDRIALKAAGDANLGILQGFFRDVRGSGRAELTASVDGPLKDPVLSGSATITAGRVRHFSLPNSLEDINGIVRFDASGIRLDELTASMGGGKVRFGGRIGLSGGRPSDLNVTMRGQQMRLRYPEGIRSLVDADLALSGSVRSPILGGTVTVRNAVWGRRIDTPGSIFDLSSRRPSSPATGPSAELDAPPPMQFNIHIIVPSTLRVENNVARMIANADLTLRGSYDRPIVSGHADIERGEVTFEGRRYRITRGAIEFSNPNRFEPFFDVEAETSVRVPGQTYRVTVGLAGTAEQVRPTLNSDPPLPTADVLALLFADARRTGTQDVAPELRALQNPNQAQTDILTTRATQALTAPLSSEVGKVVEQTFGVDTFQLAPSFVDPYSTQTSRLNPTARLTIGKRISDRVYLTFSRSLNTAFNDQIVLLEYDSSDLVSWILSRNEDEQSYAIEFRVRHVF